MIVVGVDSQMMPTKRFRQLVVDVVVASGEKTLWCNETLINKVARK